MLTITEAAGSHLADMLTEAEAPDDVAVRFIIQGRGLAMELDNASPDDSTFNHEGRTILVLDEQLSDLLSDKTLDIKDSEEGPHLTLE